MAKSAKMRQMWVMLMIFTLALSATGLGCQGPKTAKNETTLEEAVNKAWEARSKGDWSTLYALTSAAYQEKIKPEQFSRANTIQVESFAIKNIEVEGESALAHIEYQTRQGGFLFKFPAKETWVREKGGWRLDLKEQKGAAPFMKK